MDSGRTDEPTCEHRAARVLLIDLENWPNQLQKLPSDLAHFTQGSICHSQLNSAVPLDWRLPHAAAI